MKIYGTVSLDGQPLSQGQVIFMPEDSALRSEGATVTDGRFSIRVRKGPHRVQIQAQMAEPRKVDPSVPPGVVADAEYRSIIPARYNEKSTLSFTVESANDRPRFDLSTAK